jgi:hypothetical protein
VPAATTDNMLFTLRGLGPLAAAGNAGGQHGKGGGHATPRSWIAGAHHELYVARREQLSVIRNQVRNGVGTMERVMSCSIRIGEDRLRHTQRMLGAVGLHYTIRVAWLL